MTVQEATQLVASVTPRATQLFGGNPTELAYRSVIISAVETGGQFNADAANTTSSARGLMQTLICTQRFMEEKLQMPFQPASFSSKGTYCAKLYEKKEPAKVPANRDYLLATPRYGVLIGSAYLAYQLQRYNDLDRAIIAFNQGKYNATNAKNAAGYLAKYKQREAEFGAIVRRTLNGLGQQQQPLARMGGSRNDDIRTRFGILEFV
jgi:soluble lytic murein transglycosylase-like protein